MIGDIGSHTPILVDEQLSPPVVRVTELHKSFPKSRRLLEAILRPFRVERVHVLKGISFEVRAGEILGLVGPNGSGKSTLLRMLCGLLLPDSGQITLCGLAVDKDERLARAKVGYVVADERSFSGRLTGYQNIEFFARLQDIHGPQLKASVLEALEQVGLVEHKDSQFMHYSSGMKQRLAIARGLIVKPEVLLLDEPTRSLDPLTANNIRLLIKDVCVSSGCAALFASHNLHEVEAICDRVAVLRNGMLLAVGALGEITSLCTDAETYTYRLEVSGSMSRLNGLLESVEAASCTLLPGNHNSSACIELTSDSKRAVQELAFKLLEAGFEIDTLSRATATFEDAFLRISSDDNTLS